MTPLIKFENHMSDTGRPRSVRLRGHSYIAYALTPEWPITQWLGQLDESIDCFADFLGNKSIVLDLSKVTPSHSGVAHLIAELQTRRIHIMGLEGVGELGPELPPVVRGGRAAEPMEPFDTRGLERTPVAPPAQPGPASLLLDSGVRSGQSVVFRAGDVTVLGSVASGAEIVAGGSIHVYGTLRGRALAGSTGNPRARIFCRKIEAELLAIDGIYRTTEDLEPTLRSRAIQAWLQDDVMFIEPLDESH
jgi:septum site-determining protein MinC